MKYFKTAMITEKFRIIFFLLLMNGFMGILNAQNLQNAPEPKLSLSLSNVTLKQFFEEIQHKTDYYFSYREGVVDNRKDITVSVQDRSLTEILKTVLAPRGLSFSIQSKSVIITLQQAVASKPVIIKGKITDAMDEPLVGVTIRVKNGNEGATTDMDGNYSIQLKDKNSVLQFSYIGYKQKEVRTKDKAVINVLMEEDSQMLNEVVAIGYGVMRKKDLTGAVASVNSKDLKGLATTDAAAALQGKAAGIQILNSSGAPGSGAEIRVRGYSSNSGNIGPLLIVDGLKVSSIQYLDPGLIESMEVLKDAASAAIYGSEAGNGVVLITTKNGGGKGTGKITYNVRYTMNQLGHVPQLLNAEEFKDWMGMQGYNVEAAMSDAIRDYNWDQNTDTNWFDEFMGTSWSKQQ